MRRKGDINFKQNLSSTHPIILSSVLLIETCALVLWDGSLLLNMKNEMCQLLHPYYVF